MSKKKEDLIAEALEFGKELAVEVKTEGLSNSDLEKLVADLEGRYAAKLKGGALPEAPAPPAPPAPAAKVDGDKEENDGRPPKPKAAVAKHALQVAPGKAITHTRGHKSHLRQGDEVLVDDFDPGTLALLIRKGVVLDNRKK